MVLKLTAVPPAGEITMALAKGDSGRGGNGMHHHLGKVSILLNTYIVDQVDASPPGRGHRFYYPGTPVL